MRQAPRSPLSFKLQRVANVPEHPPPSTRLMSCAHIANRQLSRIIGARWPLLPGRPMLADKLYTNLRAADVRRLLEYVVELTGIAVIYVGLAKLSLALASIHPSATPIWPPTGYAFAVVLLLGYR